MTRLLYISEGDIPSRFAHATQAMNMAGALSNAVDELTLLTASSLQSSAPADEISSWYGVEPCFRIVHLPVSWSQLPFSKKEQRQQSVLNRRPSNAWKTRFVLAASSYARFKRPDLVFTRCCRVARRTTSLGLPTVVEYHGSGVDAARQLKRAPLREELLSVVTVSEFIRADFESYNIPTNKIIVEPGGVDLAPFVTAMPRDTARQQLGLPRDRPIVVYCGHFYETKGVQYLADVARYLPDVCFCLVGGWPEDIVRLQCTTCDLTNLLFPGFVSHNQVPLFLAAADLLVLPNSGRTQHAHRTCPLKLFEYAAARRPIVASRIPGIDCLVEHGQQAWLTEPDSSEGLRAGIERVLNDTALADHLAREAHCWVQQFGWDHRAKRILKRVGVLPKRAHDLHTLATRQVA